MMTRRGQRGWGEEELPTVQQLLRETEIAGQLISDRLFIQHGAEKGACLWQELMNSRIWQQPPACNTSLNSWPQKRLKLVKVDIPDTVKLKNTSTMMSQTQVEMQG